MVMVPQAYAFASAISFSEKPSQVRRLKPAWLKVVSGIFSVSARNSLPSTEAVKEKVSEKAPAREAVTFSIAASVKPLARSFSEEIPGAPSRVPCPRQ